MNRTLYFANGTTALAMAVKALTRPGDLVAIPAAVCPVAVAAILAVERRPYFVDIEPVTLGLCPEKLSTVIGEVAAVVAVHSFGTPCRIDEIAAICGKVPLIEDCAQADGAAVGTTGIVAIRSFGSGKILKLGGGGSATTRDQSLAERMAVLSGELGESDPHAADDLSRINKFFYNNFYPERCASYPFILDSMLKTCGARMLGKAPAGLPERETEARKELPRIVEERYRKQEDYRRRLSLRDEIKFLPCLPGSAPVYINILLEPDMRDQILRRLIGRHWPISSWNYDLSRVLGGIYSSTETNQSRWIDRRILNLWMDGVEPEENVATLLAEIDDFLQGDPAK